MNTRKSPLGLKQTGGALLMMAISSVMFSEAAFATSAGTVLRSDVTVTYRDSEGAAQTPETSSVDVTVDLVASVVWGAAPAGETVVSGGALPAAYTITLTNTGNGSDVYDITDGTTESCAELSTESFGFTTPVAIGAAVSSGAAAFDTPVAGQTTIPVSNITSADFTAGNTVIIGGNSYVVVSASDDADGLTPDSLVVTGDATGDVAGAGVQIGEQINFTYGGSGTAGTLDSGTDTCDHEHELTATGTLALGTPGNEQAEDTVSGWVTTVELVEITINKFVRNVTDTAKVGTGTTASWNGETYYPADVTANPGDVLEYLVVIENTGGGLATDIIFQDTLPPFTTLDTATVGVDNDNDGTLDVQVGVSGETVAAADGVIVTSGADLRIFVGGDTSETTADDTGATATTGGTGGGIAEGDTSNVIYQITIQDF